jgi:hypothetical protein
VVFVNQIQIRKQLELMLRDHPYIGKDTGPLEGIIEHYCACKLYEPGEVLCKEGDPGHSLFFLLSGDLKVTRLDRNRVPRDLATIKASTMVGHMSLIDRSRRSATCTVSARAYIGELTFENYKRLIESAEIEGIAFRRMLLASLQQQLHTGISKLRGLISPEQEKSFNNVDTKRVLSESTAALSGWTPSDPSDNWKSQILDRARNLPMESGARMLIEIESELPFCLEIEFFEPIASKKTFTRFIRFLNAIPTPPQARIRFRNCPSDLIPRPQVVAQSLRMYFPKKSFLVTGSEKDIQIEFINPDERWFSIQWVG